MDGIWQSLIGNLAVSALTVSTWLHVRRHLEDGFTHLLPVLFGALLGVGAVVTMVLTIEVQHGVYFDLRSSLVGIAALFGGPLGGVIALLPPLAYRLYLGGQGAMAGSSLIVASCLLGLAGHVWSSNRPVRFSTALVLASAIAGATMISIALIPGLVAEGRWLTVTVPIFVLSFAATTVAGYFLIVAESEAAEREIASAAFDQAPDFAYVKNRAGKFVAVNRTTAAYHGFEDPREMLGLSDFDLTNEQLALELYKAEQQAMQDRTFISNKEELILAKDGEERWFSTSKAPLVSKRGEVIGITGVTRDVTREKQIATDLLESQRRLSYVMSEMSDGIALFHKEGILLFSNERYCDLFPLTKAVRRPGMDLRDILQAVQDTGEQKELPEDPSSWADAAVLALKTGGHEQLHMYDGRWLNVRTRPTAEATSIVIVSDITEAKSLEFDLRSTTEKFQHLAEVDGLTDLPNRRTFDNVLAKELGRTGRSGTPLSLLMIDVDRFKAFNDHYGHLAGDQCLRVVAQCLKEAIRRPMDLAARYGGEEFGVVLPDTDEDGAYHVAMAIAAQLRQANIPHEASEHGSVTVSIGVASYRKGEPNRTATVLLGQADQALYGAKAAGRNRVNGNVSAVAQRWAV